MASWHRYVQQRVHHDHSARWSDLAWKTMQVQPMLWLKMAIWYHISIEYIHTYLYLYLYQFWRFNIHLMVKSPKIGYFSRFLEGLGPFAGPRCAELLHVLCRSPCAARPECQPALLEGCARPRKKNGGRWGGDESLGFSELWDLW